MGFLDSLFGSTERLADVPSGERPTRPFGGVIAEGSGEDRVEGEQRRPEIAAVDEARKALVDELTRLVMEVPRRVTAQPSRRIVTGTMTAHTGEDGSQLIGFQPDRMRVTVQNQEAAQAESVYVAATSWDASVVAGYRIAPGESVTWETASALYVRTMANTALVGFLIEFGE